MKERPIIFSAPMVRAILDGTKTQTRRKLPAGAWLDIQHGVIRQCSVACGVTGFEPVSCRYGQPGDRLWVRETWSDDCDHHWTMYRADSRAERRAGGEVFDACDSSELNATPKWRPSIHMPRWASRITLEVTSVRVQRLQHISRGDAMAEGCPFANMAAGPDPRDWYADLWAKINGHESWSTDPWVWVIEFRHLEGGAA